MIEQSGELRESLAKAISLHSSQKPLLVVDAAAECIRVHELVRLANGVPSGRSWRTPWSQLLRNEQLDRRAVLDRVPHLHDAATVLLACTSAAGMRPLLALNWLAAERPDAQTARVDGAPVADLIREVIAEEPLGQSYELVTVREAESGRPELSGRLLFPVGSRRGDREPLELRCEPAGEDGTVFAVMAWSPEKGTLSMVSLRRIRLAPGRYRLSAELRGPGRIAFHGLPGPLLREERSAAELVAALPARLARTVPQTHLICAVETRGEPDAVAARLHRARAVITEMAAGRRPGFTVSLVEYGSHSYERRPRGTPVEVLVWNGPPDKALTSLDELAARPTEPPGHPRAAPVECVLTEVDGRLGAAAPARSGTRKAEAGRTALLLFGDRPPHPPLPVPGLLPCPAGVDWEEPLARLRHGRRVRVGAVCADPAARSHPAWTRLAGGAPADAGATGLQMLVARLGLGPDEGYRVPFPISESP